MPPFMKVDYGLVYLKRSWVEISGATRFRRYRRFGHSTH